MRSKHTTSAGRVRYAPVNLALIFFSYSVVGWLWEVLLDLFQTGAVVNCGTMYGPWAPTYGVGGIATLLLFRRLIGRPVVTFFAAAALCGALEYFTGKLLLAVTGERWWDYGSHFLNIGGWVSPRMMLIFGLGACLGIYLAAPAMNTLYGRLPLPARRLMCALLLAVFAADLMFSAASPNTASTVV